MKKVSNATVITPNGVNRYHSQPFVFEMRPVPSIACRPFQANTLQEVGEWILAQGFGAFQDWKIDSVNEEEHAGENPQWEGYIRFLTPKGNAYLINFDCSVLIPQKKKTFEEMTAEEKTEALALALAKSGIQL